MVKIPESKTERDTVEKVIYDTLEIEKPVPYKVTERDTIYITDTLVGSYFVHEVKEYIHPTFYAKISGINAKLNEIKVYPKTVTKYITTTEKVYEKPKKWGFGPTVGVGVVNNKFYPYIGVGVTYNIIQW